MSSGPLVLCFHAASDVWEHELALPAATIIDQVSQFAARSRDRALHVTFDDAFRSALDVLPALERLGVGLTIFACTDYARDGRPLDVPELASYAAELPDELVTMDWDTLRTLAGRGVEIGSHTRTHPHLTRLSDRELELEVRESRARIEMSSAGPAASSPIPLARKMPAFEPRLAPPGTRRLSASRSMSETSVRSRCRGWRCTAAPSWERAARSRVGVDSHEGDKFEIIVICSGNRFRSPLVAA